MTATSAGSFVASGSSSPAPRSAASRAAAGSESVNQTVLDGTNVVSRADKVCVITDIGLDHINILGDTLAKIAKQKAGIIQPGNEVFSYPQAEEVLNVFSKKCAKQKATLNLVNRKSLGNGFSFLPQFQQHNFGLAQAVVSHVLQREKHRRLWLCGRKLLRQ